MAVLPSSSSRLSPSPPPFAPIQEEETEHDEPEPEPEKSTAATYHHQPTPLHPSAKSSRSEDLSVSCSKCRPSSRDKITVVPLDINGPKRPSSVSGSTPNALLRSLFRALAPKTPLHIASTPCSSSDAQENAEWKLTAAELSRKLLHVTRKRDEAILEASRLKYSVSKLERKLNQLESRCRDLQTSLDRCIAGPNETAVEPFILAVNDARTAVRQLSRYLIAQLRAAPRSMDRLGSILRSNGLVKKNPGSLIIGLESVLNRVFYSDFERAGEGEGMLADPADRCKANRAAYEAIRGLGWEDVLSKGTRYFSEGLSRFCDRRMSEVVGMLGWARAWPEGLLQAFFGAARGVWAVFLLARSVHPGMPILRVDRGARFDPVYMEESTGVKPGTGEVIMMVAPGFYVHGATCSVVKCRVIVAFREQNESNCDRLKL
ncbi:IRK-interacting protein [Phalaenopsis equestris]|uniref:IRK-interacting protein n=1 Tax=Phalaenopsis equestris TaxID=78828 RepID=UPI0009E3E527|nr:IRK-interacting protein [Phalaenopsis equestris]